MYKLKPVVDPNLIVSPKCDMYVLKNIHGPSNGQRVVVANAQEGEDELQVLKDIASRQERLIEKLKALDLKLDQTAAARGISLPVSGYQGAPNDLTKIVGTTTIVVNADPNRPPFSLLTLSKMWPAGLPIGLTFHVHSSVKTLPKDCLDFQKTLSRVTFNNSSNINLRIIWKNGLDSDFELVISPVRSVPILGEANFLRFLNSVAPSPTVVPSDRIDQRVMLDDLLDVCHALNNNRSPVGTERCLANLLRYAAMGTGSVWLTGSVSPSLADAAAWSAVKRSKSANKLPQLGKTWFEKCEKVFSC